MGSNTKPKLIPVTKWNEHHDWPSIPAWRKLIFNSETNGIDSVICRIGRRILIDEDAFYDWVRDRRES